MVKENVVFYGLLLVNKISIKYVVVVFKYSAIIKEKDINFHKGNIKYFLSINFPKFAKLTKVCLCKGLFLRKPVLLKFIFKIRESYLWWLEQRGSVI